MLVSIAQVEPAGFEELARSGQWAKLLEVAQRRADQLPLSTDEALIAAHAARVLGDVEIEVRLLEAVAAAGSSDLAELARVQLASAVAGSEPVRAVDLALPGFSRGRPDAVRETAGEVVIGVVAARREEDRRQAVEVATSRLPMELERRLQLVLAETDALDRQTRLERLLGASTRDLAALAAAESLAGEPELSPRARWRVANAFYRHAMYERAVPFLEELAASPSEGVPDDEVAFLRGRCAFRRGSWSEAIEWYRKALASAHRNSRRAEIEVHIGRCFELEGDLDEAVAAAVRSVRLDTTDERRLFLARLRLRRGEMDLAAQGLARLRSRRARAQGELMLAMAALRRGDADAAAIHLDRSQRGEWAGPATVFRAELAAAAGASEAAVFHLERSWRSLGPFWGRQARAVMARLPEQQLRQWRLERRDGVGRAEGRSRWRELAHWAVLEPDPEALAEIRLQVDSLFAEAADVVKPRFAAGLASELWRLGLEREAARWDPSGFPRADAGQSAWTAQRFLEFDLPWRALRSADGAWRQAGSEMPARALPEFLRRALYPLPEATTVREVAAFVGVDWPLLAAVAREESRWDPRALSAVGARGLVQLMPSTAAAVAGRIGVALTSMDELFVPRTNLTLGGAELGRLLEVFDGRWAPAVAAYNAGEVQAAVWLEQCGDGCSEGRYVASISFAATRSYTADVLAAAESYAGSRNQKSRPAGLGGRPLSD